MKLDVFTVDAFTSRPFSGNPAAVIPLLQMLDEKTLQQVASELNLSETAYVAPLAEGKASWQECDRFSLRWFTPTNEVPLCGHATLATSHVLLHCLGNSNTRLKFETKSGTLVARRDDHCIILDFPANPPETLTPAEETQLSELVKVASGGLLVSQVLISRTTRKLLVRLHPSCTRQQLEALQLDTGDLLRQHDGSLVKGVILTLGAEDNGDPQPTAECHCYSRYYAPWNGIPEDPVTGSAHTVLGPYWAEQLGCTVLKCKQVSPRGGDVTVTVRNDGRVDLAGESTTVLQGHITLSG
ncbi:phenazine biosynthesis-like domain-containing protein isoform X1 [Portunus trituberculatus]|uniref:phenazine biosynthesis-like domain-containing protein isoform X1 n=2 Tax=Portunus trituberculatus TaxID=210409 RepID=UPI001E1CE372|nr:phenazine biosynthesis-like domain-containing protein isoform X1 [Portunus trituberculatus]XP_045137363.1 phenazine biosynthesis-like domain-containing protein isoform X1 [Portunus trituberculatus]